MPRCTFTDLPIVPTVPGPAHDITNLPFLLPLANGNDFPNTFMTRNDWETVAETAMSDSVV